MAFQKIAEESTAKQDGFEDGKLRLGQLRHQHQDDIENE